jgi:hypothetical protein
VAAHSSRAGGLLGNGRPFSRRHHGKPSLNLIAQFDDECAAALQELQIVHTLFKLGQKSFVARYLGRRMALCRKILKRSDFEEPR